MHTAAFQQNLVQVQIIINSLMYREAGINGEDEKSSLLVYSSVWNRSGGPKNVQVENF
jgi:hypothetical protein